MTNVYPNLPALSEWLEAELVNFMNAPKTEESVAKEAHKLVLCIREKASAETVLAGGRVFCERLCTALVRSRTTAADADKLVKDKPLGELIRVLRKNPARWLPPEAQEVWHHLSAANEYMNLPHHAHNARSLDSYASCGYFLLVTLLRELGECPQLFGRRRVVFINAIPADERKGGDLLSHLCQLRNAYEAFGTTVEANDPKDAEAKESLSEALSQSDRKLLDIQFLLAEPVARLQDEPSARKLLAEAVGTVRRWANDNGGRDVAREFEAVRQIRQQMKHPNLPDIKPKRLERLVQESARTRVAEVVEALAEPSGLLLGTLQKIQTDFRRLATEVISDFPLAALKQKATLKSLKRIQETVWCASLHVMACAWMRLSPTDSLGCVGLIASSSALLASGSVHSLRGQAQAESSTEMPHTTDASA